MNEPTDHNMAVWERAQQERRERVQRILETAFVVGVELRPSGFVRREWMRVVLDDGTIIHGDVFKGRPLVRSIEIADLERGGKWREFEEPPAGSELDRLAHAVVMEALRAHAGAARRREATA